MTPAPFLARAIAAALLDGPWHAEAMRARLRAVFDDEDRRWMRSLARHAVHEFVEPPRDAPDALARWLRSRRAFRAAVRDSLTVRRWALPHEQMGTTRWPVPAIDTQGDLAVWLDLDVDELIVLADRRGLSRRAADPRMRHYRYRWSPKRTGGHRLLEAPKLRLRTIQRLILDGILAHIPPHFAAHGFRAGHSVVGFAREHVGQATVLRVDLHAFFTSVSVARVYGIFRTAGYAEEVARTLASLCTHGTPPDVLASVPSLDPADRRRLLDPHLPQGAPTSGALSNLAAYRLDVRVAGLARAMDARYSRYADDLVLSGGQDLARAAPAVIARLGAIAAEEGFSLNFKKTRVMTAGGRQEVTGVVVNRKTSLRRDEVERLRAIIHNCQRTGPDAQNREARPDFRSYLLGKIGWVSQLDPAHGARLRAAFDRIVWT